MSIPFTVKVNKAYSTPKPPQIWRGTIEFTDNDGNWLMTMETTIVENTKDGSVFVGWPSRKTPNGEYMSQVRSSRELGDAIITAVNEHVNGGTD